MQKGSPRAQKGPLVSEEGLPLAHGEGQLVWKRPVLTSEIVPQWELLLLQKRLESESLTLLMLL